MDKKKDAKWKEYWKFLDSLNGYDRPYLRRLVGSQSIFEWDPPDDNSDVDILMCSEFLGDLEDWLKALGFEMTNEPGYGGGTWFLTYRKGWLNVIATNSYEFYARFIGANDVARQSADKFELFKEKEDRIKFFDKVLYDTTPFPQVGKEPIKEPVAPEIPINFPRGLI